MTYAILERRASSTAGYILRAALNQRPKTTASAGEYKPSSADFLKSFYAVQQRWERETQFLSSSKLKKQHPAYQVLVENAKLTLPLILSELQRRPSHLVWILNEIATELPFTEEEAGDISAMSAAWVKWGKEDGKLV